MAGMCPLVSKACIKDSCMLYNVATEKCAIKEIAENLGDCAESLQILESDIRTLPMQLPQK